MAFSFHLHLPLHFFICLPASPSLCLTPCLPFPLLISLECMCVCVFPLSRSLPASLLSSRSACCTALRRRLSWSSVPPGPLVRPGPRTCGSRWAPLSRVWAWRACLGRYSPFGPRVGGTSLAEGSLGVCLCSLTERWQCARNMEARAGQTLSPHA